MLRLFDILFKKEAISFSAKLHKYGKIYLYFKVILYVKFRDSQ